MWFSWMERLNCLQLTEVSNSLDSPAMTILPTGNIGIGASNPASKLQVDVPVKLGLSGTQINSMGVCLITFALNSTTETTAVCTGLPADANIAVNCSPTSAPTATSAFYFRATGTATQIAAKSTAATVSSNTYAFFFARP